MDDVIYVLDANVFIEAARRYYAFDIAPTFWERLVHYASNNRVQSIDKIKEELERGKDELAIWARDNFSDAFASTNEENVIESYTEIMRWVQNQSQFSDAAKADFATSADGWLVAYARSNGCIVVTHELPATDVKKRVPIPNVCDAFDVDYIDTFKMLRELGVRFT